MENEQECGSSLNKVVKRGRKRLDAVPANAWEQQPNEGGKAFAAFKLYMELGEGRTAVEVARRLKKSESFIGQWAARWEWRRRVRAFDAHLAQVDRESTEMAIRSQAGKRIGRQLAAVEEEWRISQELIEAGREALRRWRANASRCGSLEGISRMLDLATKLARLASGLPTDHTEISGEVTLTLDTEWELAIKKVYGETVQKEIEVEASKVTDTKTERPGLGAA